MRSFEQLVQEVHRQDTQLVLVSLGSLVEETRVV